MAVEDVLLRLKILGRRDAKKDLDGTTRDLKQMGDQAERSGRRGARGLGIMKKAVVGIAAGLAIGAVAFIKMSVEAFKTYDAGLDAIRAGTGATGATLDAFAKNMENVGKRVTQPLDQVGQVLADLNTRTGQTGKPLEQLTEQFLNLERVSKEAAGTTVPAVTRAFGDWAIAAQDQAAALDWLFKTSQATGQTVGALADQAVKYGAPLRQLGFDFETSAALLGKFEKEGVNTELVMGGLRQSLGRMAKAGKEPQQAFFDTVKAIEAAGTAGEANTKAIELFGAKAGPDMAAAIREGRFSVEELMATLHGSSDTINQTAADTASFADRWAMLKNRATPYLAKFGAKLSELGVRIIDWAERNEEKIKDFVIAVAGMAVSVAEGFSRMAQGALYVLGEFMAGLRPITKGVFIFADGVLAAMENALGWLPGWKGKFQDARASLDEFAAKADTKLGDVSDDLHNASESAGRAADKMRSLGDRIAEIQSKRVTVTVDYQEVGGLTVRQADRIAVKNSVVRAEPRALGGPVKAFRPYIVGEHRPELFIPEVSGRIEPRLPEMTPRGSDGASLSDHSRCVHVHEVYLDGKQVKASVETHTVREEANS